MLPKGRKELQEEDKLVKGDISHIYIKLADEVYAFLTSKVWGVIRYKLSMYTNNLDMLLHNAVERQDIKAAAILEGKIRGIKEGIKIIERLTSEIKEGKLDVDAALGVIEKKTKK